MNIVHFSGGKDSTAMCHLMIENGVKIDHVVYLDTGWEFDEMKEHIELFEKKTGLKIFRIDVSHLFEHLMYHHLVREKNNNLKIGYGWPLAQKWCTGRKQDALSKFTRTVPDAIEHIGFAFDETNRAKKLSESKKNKGRKIEFPLIEYGMTETEALLYCLRMGYRWSGLYDYFTRLSCFCCPHKTTDDYRALKREYPQYWEKTKDMAAKVPSHAKIFHNNQSVEELDKKI